MLKKEYTWPKLGECGCIKIKNKIICFPFNMNALCSVDIETGNVEPIEGISNEYFDEYSLITNICRFQNEIICIPHAAKRPHIIDLETRQEVEFAVQKDEMLPAGGYYNTYLTDKYCYIFPFSAGKMMRLDLREKSITRIIDIKEQYKSFSGCNYKYFSYSGCYEFEGKLYMIMRDDPIMVEYDMFSEEISFYRMEGDSPIYIHLMGYENYVYAVGNDGKIYIWNVRSHEIETILKIELHEGENERFKHSARYGKYLYLFKYIYADEFIRIDIERNQADVLSMKEMYKSEELLLFMCMDEEKIYFVSQKHILYIVDSELGDVKKISLILNNEKMNQFIFSHLYQLSEKVTGTICEGAYVWTLENYIIKNVASIKDKQLADDKKVGSVIYQTINK